MTDYARMHRHLVYRRWAFVMVVLCGMMAIPECYVAFSYHFPILDDIGMCLTFLLFYLARFVIRKTEMYAVQEITGL